MSRFILIIFLMPGLAHAQQILDLESGFELGWPPVDIAVRYEVFGRELSADSTKTWTEAPHPDTGIIQLMTPEMVCQRRYIDPETDLEAPLCIVKFDPIDTGLFEFTVFAITALDERKQIAKTTDGDNGFHVRIVEPHCKSEPPSSLACTKRPVAVFAGTVMVTGSGK